MNGFLPQVSKFTLALVAMLILSSCVNMAFSGAQAVYNRNNLKQTLNDHYISLKSEHTIYNKKQFKGTNISVAAFNNVVLITGEVPKPEQKYEVEQLVRNIAGDSELHNLLSISPPSSSLTRVSDSLITAKIKTKLIASENIDPSQIKVITESGTVYLMGIIPPEQAEAAIEVARTTTGVQNVVKVLSYLRITKT